MDNDLPFDLMGLLPIIIAIVIWDGVWKLAAMWRAAQNKQLLWFLCIAILNTCGLLPIIYLLISKKKGN